MKTYYFTADIQHCVAVEAENKEEALKLALEEFNDMERLMDIQILEGDIQLELEE